MEGSIDSEGTVLEALEMLPFGALETEGSAETSVAGTIGVGSLLGSAETFPIGLIYGVGVGILLRAPGDTCFGRFFFLLPLKPVLLLFPPLDSQPFEPALSLFPPFEL